MKKVLLFAGSNSFKSINRKVVKYAADLLNGYSTNLIDLRDYPLPLFSVDLEAEEGVPKAAYELKDLLLDHHALVVSVAENNGSITAFLKNTLDWVSRSQDDYRILKGKKVWLLSASPAKSGGVGALEHARDIFSMLGADIAGSAPIGSFDNTGQVAIRQQISRTLENFESVFSKNGYS